MLYRNSAGTKSHINIWILLAKLKTRFASTIKSFLQLSVRQHSFFSSSVITGRASRPQSNTGSMLLVSKSNYWSGMRDVGASDRKNTQTKSCQKQDLPLEKWLIKAPKSNLWWLVLPGFIVLVKFPTHLDELPNDASHAQLTHIKLGHVSVPNRHLHPATHSCYIAGNSELWEKNRIKKRFHNLKNLLDNSNTPTTKKCLLLSHSITA